MSSEGFGAFDHRKYPIYQPLKKADRRWPDQVLTKAPEWCSVDLRDGNQALIEPMTSDKKLRLWELLVDLGFKQIEVGFPLLRLMTLIFCESSSKKTEFPAM